MSATPPEADLVWHYTSGASLLSILQNDVLWATAAPFLNDAQEIAIGSAASGVDDDLVGAAIALDGGERLRVLIERESVGDDAIGPSAPGPQRRDGRREGGHLGEGPLDRDLPAEDVEGVEGDDLVSAGHAIHEDGAAIARERDTHREDLGRAGRLDHIVISSTAGGGHQGGLVGLHVIAVDDDGVIDSEALRRLQFVCRGRRQP